MVDKRFQYSWLFVLLFDQIPPKWIMKFIGMLPSSLQIGYLAKLVDKESITSIPGVMRCSHLSARLKASKLHSCSLALTLLELRWLLKCLNNFIWKFYSANIHRHMLRHFRCVWPQWSNINWISPVMTRNQQGCSLYWRNRPEILKQGASPKSCQFWSSGVVKNSCTFRIQFLVRLKSRSST